MIKGKFSKIPNHFKRFLIPCESNISVKGFGTILLPLTLGIVSHSIWITTGKTLIEKEIHHLLALCMVSKTAFYFIMHLF